MAYNAYGQLWAKPNNPARQPTAGNPAGQPHRTTLQRPWQAVIPNDFSERSRQASVNYNLPANLIKQTCDATLAREPVRASFAHLESCYDDEATDITPSNWGNSTIILSKFSFLPSPSIGENNGTHHVAMRARQVDMQRKRYDSAALSMKARSQPRIQT